ncbi:MAG: RodZ domain-containing protein [Veillonellales bacterium]
MQTVGQALRSEREKKNLTIKDIEAATSIRSLYINAIEEDNYKVIPGEVYLKGFIRNYANYLGLNGEEMVALYRESQAPVEPEPEVPARKKVAPKKDTPVSLRTGGKGKWAAVGVVAVCLAGIIWWAAGNKIAEPQQPAPEAKSAPAAPVQPLPSAVPQQQATSASDKSAATKPVAVTAKFTDACWTLVKADGKEIYEGIPKTGETITWQAEKNIALQLGNAGAVDIVYNGQSVGKIGGKGEVVSKTFSANNAKP